MNKRFRSQTWLAVAAPLTSGAAAWSLPGGLYQI